MTYRYGIEDPFETHYDVAHVLKDSRYQYIRKEFARAYILMEQFGRDVPPSALGSTNLLKDKLEEILHPVECVPWTIDGSSVKDLKKDPKTGVITT